MNIMLKSVHENLQQLIYDENKIVTYKLLTRLLKINVNVAKKCLQDFFDLNQEDLNAFYILIGVQKDENDQPFTKIIVVPAAEVDETKKSFTEVTSSHIYCIHKGQLVDRLALFTANCEGQAYNQNLNEHSAIRNPHVCIESKKRNIKPTAIKPEIKSLPQVTTKKQVEKKNNDIEQLEKRDSISPSKKKSAKADDRSSSVNSKSKSSNIVSMFQKKQSEKKPNDQKVQKRDSAPSDIKKADETNEDLSTKTDQKGKKDIKHLFAKQIGKGTQLLSEENKEKSILNVNHKRKHSQSKGTKQKRSSSKQKKKSESDSDESEKPQKKKHKRIVQIEDSESESENEELVDRAQRELIQCEPDVSAFTSPTVNEVLSEDDDCIPPTAVTDGKKKKKWKIITKTSVDDNGFFVTKKTKEYVTDSEESDNESKKESKSPAAAHEPVKKASFTNRKQSSLMSFFGKK